MSTNYRNSSGVDFDSLFDPYVQGSSPSPTGYRLVSGVDLAARYAPISFGSKGPDVNYRLVSGVDVSNLWAAIGTASYNAPLPINGQTFKTGVLIPSGGTGSTSVAFGLTSSTAWNVTNSGAGGTVSPYPQTYASGSVPNGAASVQFVLSLTAGYDAGSTANGAASASSLAAGVLCGVTASGRGVNAGEDAKYTARIIFRNAAASIISETTITLQAAAEGSA